MFLDKSQKKTLQAVCDTLCPEELFEPDAGVSSQSLADRIESALTKRNSADQSQIIELLVRINHPVLAFAMCGKAVRFAVADRETRTKILFAMSRSRSPRLRAGFQALKRLTLFIAYADQRIGSSVWQEINYPGERTTTSTNHPQLNIVNDPGDDECSCDVLVIGSGSGGAVVAAELAATGLNVIVVDKGDYFGESGFPKSELHGMQQMYEGGGLSTTDDLGTILLAGSTVGGGTAVNWMTSLRPPSQLLTQWRNGFELSSVYDDSFETNLIAIEQRLNVNVNESGGSLQNAKLEIGCTNLGTTASVIPRNARDCGECGFCVYGCECGAKQDVRQTFLADACVHGTRIIPRCTVQSVHHVSGKAAGALVEFRTKHGETRQFQIRAKKVVVSAGSLHTPAILLRSGLTNRNIGNHLCLHPVYAVFGQFDEPIRAWSGPPQTRIFDELADLDRHGYGTRLEVAPAHPGLWALGLPWRSGEQHRRFAKQMDRLANIMVLTRDHGKGSVSLGRNGGPKIGYTLQPIDAQHAQRGIVEAIRILHAAGAKIVYGADNDADQFPDQRFRNLESFLQFVGNKPIRSNHPTAFSAHQLASCRMSGNVKSGAVRPNGETWEIENLYVADGSVLPTSTGVNPMITIMATAHRLAQSMK